MSQEHQKSEKVNRVVYRPAVDAVQNSDGLQLYIDLPGVDEKSVEISLEARELTIEAKSALEIPEGLKATLQEFEIADYKWAATLAEDVDKSKIKAKVQDGVLSLYLPKVEEAKAYKIPISA